MQTFRHRILVYGCEEAPWWRGLFQSGWVEWNIPVICLIVLPRATYMDNLWNIPVESPASLCVVCHRQEYSTNMPCCADHKKGHVPRQANMWNIPPSAPEGGGNYWETGQKCGIFQAEETMANTHLLKAGIKVEYCTQLPIEEYSTKKASI